MSTEQQSGGSDEPPQFFSFQKILQGVKYNHCKNNYCNNHLKTPLIVVYYILTKN
jgi:hypothetical protein